MMDRSRGVRLPEMDSECTPAAEREQSVPEDFQTHDRFP